MDDRYVFRWMGDAMQPVGRWQRLCDEHFVIGKIYNFVEDQAASDANRRWYFACIREAWRNLPDALAEKFPTAESLRKKALIITGWREERMFVAASKAEARRLAAFMAPIDTDSVVDIDECVIRIWTAKSQKRRAMNKQEFRESADDVLSYCADLIGVTKDQLEREGHAEGHPERPEEQ